MSDNVRFTIDVEDALAKLGGLTRNFRGAVRRGMLKTARVQRNIAKGDVRGSGIHVKGSAAVKPARVTSRPEGIVARIGYSKSGFAVRFWDSGTKERFWKSGKSTGLIGAHGMMASAAASADHLYKPAVEHSLDDEIRRLGLS